MKSPSTVDTMLRLVTAELDAEPDDEIRRELAALKSALLWCRHGYIHDERITRHFTTDRMVFPPEQEANVWVGTAAHVIAANNTLSPDHEDFIEAGRALYREGLLNVPHRGDRS